MADKKQCTKHKKCQDCKNCMICNHVCEAPYSKKELETMESLCRKSVPVSKEKYMKLIQFAKNFAGNEEMKEIIKARASEEQKKSFTFEEEKVEEKVEDKKED